MEHLQWTSHWESDLIAQDHTEISSALIDAFPFAAAGLGGSHSWIGARPELRILGKEAGAVIAHVGILRRFVRIADANQLVGEAGLLLVHSSRRGRGIGRAIVRELNTRLRELNVPFGLLNCVHDLIPFYVAEGWHYLPNLHTRHIAVRAPFQAETLDYPVLALPVSAQIQDWPTGDLMVLDGLET